MMVNCDVCLSEFTQKKSLYAHIRKFHNRDLIVLKKNPVVKCEECPSEFSHRKHLYAHARKIHKKELVSKKNSAVKCKECGSEFSQKKHLYAHARKFHKKNLFVFKKNPDLKCNVCNKLFSFKSTLHRHEINVHKSQTDHYYTRPSHKSSRLLCPQGPCAAAFPNYERLRNHLQTHNIKVEKEDHEFTSLEAFESWKNNIQQKETSLYTSDSAPKKLSTTKAWNQFYNCHRSYFYVPEGKKKRLLKSVGSNKIGRACPSRIKATMIGKLNEPSLIKVQYWKTHVGHGLQLGHVSLGSKTRAEIAGKLKEGVSFNHILDTIRDNVVKKHDVNQRLSILERKDLHNIVRDFNIDHCSKRHQNDAVSVKIWVSEMQGSEDNPVLYYKGQDEEDVDTNLNVSDFALIIMTNFQADQFIKFGKNKVCVDGTHGTNAYDIQLYTIMTVDEFGTGCPVAYCFSNRSDKHIFTLFFSKIKLNIGVINAAIFMSDDAPAFYNAWASVMGEADHKLLCSWHVDRNWRLNLSKISGGVNKQALVYKTLKVLQQMTDIEQFQSSLIEALNQLDNDNDTKYFGNYIRTHYANRPETWAYCYRKGLGINTNMYLESYHKILKHIYLEGRKAKRLDKTINAVLKVARDSLFKRLINITKNKRTQKIQQIIASHKCSEAIPIDSIKTIEEGKHWLVLSSSNSSVQYHVGFVQETCNNLCLACAECKICIHSFQCSCSDNVIKLNICKHIHACARKCSVKCNIEQLENFNETNNEVSRLLNMSQNAIPKITANATLIKKFEFVIGLLNKPDYLLSSENYQILERHADNCISLLNKKDTVVLRTTENVNVQQKMEKQHRLYSTKAKRKNNGIQLSKPSMVEEAAIKNGLYNNSDKVLNIHSGFDHTYV